MQCEIAVYGRGDARIWHVEHVALDLVGAIRWQGEMIREAEIVMRREGGHFIDQHIFDPEQNARNR